MSIPYGRQDIHREDVDAVVSALTSDWLTQGPAVPRFERAVSEYCGAGYAVAVNSGTSALHVACLALGLGRGDRLWTSPITFVASANCALYCGADIDFVDIDPRTSNLCVRALERKLADAEREGRLPRIVVPVHMCGLPCDMADIHRLSQRYGFRIVEDASHAIGGRYQGEPVGRCRYSDITVFSFHPVKIITTAEGGVAVTNDPALAGRMARLRSHGITRDPAEMTCVPDGPWFYQQIELGFNYRMTDLQAALGLSQMQRLDAYVERRHQIARRYDERLAELPLALPPRRPDSRSALHLYIARVDQGRAGTDRGAVFVALRKKGIGVNVHYIPVHTQPFYERMGFRSGQFPESERHYAQAISLPIYPGLSEAQQDRVVAALRGALGA